MAFAKFAAFDNASEEFNSDLARLVEGFTHSLVKLISQEYARNEDREDGSGSKKSSPFSSPKGKAPRKKAAPKRGRPSKDETDVAIEGVSDMRSVSDELEQRTDFVRSSSNINMHDENCDSSVAVSLDDMFNPPSEIPKEADVEADVAETTPTKKGKSASTKEKKERVPKAPKEPKEPKEPKKPKEKKERVVKEPKGKKEKVDKEPKEKKEKVVKGKGAKKDDNVTTVPVDVQEEPVPVASTLVAFDDDDDDGMEGEVILSQTASQEVFEKLTEMLDGIKITGQLDEECDYAQVNIVEALEIVITSSQNSQDDEIVIENVHQLQEDDNDDHSEVDDDHDVEGSDAGNDPDEL
jgi:hypothetical protein